SLPCKPMSWLWAWMIEAPASTQRRTSSPISAGVNGTCGFRAGLVIPLIAASMITGVSLMAANGNSGPAGVRRRRVGHQHLRRSRRQGLRYAVMTPPLGHQHEQRPPVRTTEHGCEQVALERHPV